MTLGEKLKLLRHRRTLRTVFAGTGLSISYLSDLENNRTNPSLKSLMKLAVYYDMDIVGILHGVGDYISPQSEVQTPSDLLEQLHGLRNDVARLSGELMAMAQHIQILLEDYS